MRGFLQFSSWLSRARQVGRDTVLNTPGVDPYLTSARGYLLHDNGNAPYATACQRTTSALAIQYQSSPEVHTSRMFVTAGCHSNATSTLTWLVYYGDD